MDENKELLLECFIRCGGNSIMAESAYWFIMEMEQNGTCSTAQASVQWPPSEYETTVRPLGEEDFLLTTDENEGPSICFSAPKENEVC